MPTMNDCPLMAQFFSMIIEMGIIMQQEEQIFSSQLVLID